MRFLAFGFVALLFVQSCIAAAITSPPAGAIVVSKTKVSGTYYTTVQAAVNAANPNGPATIFIYPGTYNEQVLIERKKPLTIQGYTTESSSYSRNQVLITAKTSAAVAGSNDKSATVRAHLDNLTVYNINVRNEFTESQAIAISLVGSKQGWYGVQALGWQDTILTQDGTHFFGRSYIEGAVDFIFGQRGRSYFKKCDIRSIGAGWITANGRDSNTNPALYVFDQCTIAAGANAKPNTKGNVYLGRPWRDYARVVYKGCSISDIINPAGWSVWTAGVTPQNVLYGEYKNFGAGADTSKRAKFSRVLSDGEMNNYTSKSVLNGDTTWVNPAFL